MNRLALLAVVLLAVAGCDCRDRNATQAQLSPTKRMICGGLLFFDGDRIIVVSHKAEYGPFDLPSGRIGDLARDYHHKWAMVDVLVGHDFRYVLDVSDNGPPKGTEEDTEVRFQALLMRKGITK